MLDALADLPSAPAVYAIENGVDGKVYIGSSLNARRRVRHHRYQLRRGSHRDGYLQRAFAPYGVAAFRAFVLEPLPAGATAAHLLRAEHGCRYHRRGPRL